MNNPHRLQDEDIVGLLAELNNAEQADYPVELQKKRRAAFMALVGGLSPTHSSYPTQPAAPHPSHAALKPSLLQALPSVPGHFLTTIAIIAAAVGMAVGVYAYRENIRRWLLPVKPMITAVAPGQILPLSASATPQPSPTFDILPTSTAAAQQAQAKATIEKKVVYPTATPRPGLRFGNTKTPKPAQANKTPGPKNTPNSQNPQKPATPTKKP